MKSVTYIDDLKKWRANFSFYIPIRIRFTETDMAGHVNNVSAFIYFEEARLELLKSVGLFDVFIQENSTTVTADLQCDYHKQIYFKDQLKLYVKVNHAGTSSLDIHYMGLNQKGDICLTGRGRLVYINLKTGKPSPLTSSVKEKLLMK